MRAAVIASTASLFLTLVMNVPARADFMLGRPAEGEGPGQTAPAPALPPASNATPAAPRIPWARGFGHDIPLGFAVRQIVPPAVKVRYAEGVDQAALVNWTGNAPWPRVLATTVRPLGLRIAIGVAGVLIQQ